MAVGSTLICYLSVLLIKFSRTRLNKKFKCCNFAGWELGISSEYFLVRRKFFPHSYRYHRLIYWNAQFKKKFDKNDVWWEVFLVNYITNNYQYVIPEGQKEANVLGVAGVPILYMNCFFFYSWSKRGFDLKKPKLIKKTTLASCKNC